MSIKYLVLVAAAIAASVVACDFSDRASAFAGASCGPAIVFKGAPILRLGPVRVAGFSSAQCAWIRPACGPKVGGFQSKLSLELSEASASPIVLQTRPSEPVKFILVGRTTPAPKVPLCLSADGAHAKVSLKAPKTYYVLFVFVRAGVSFHLTASRSGHRLGTAVLACRA
jgi:hypothetical protein